jgi:hypothetical protein
MRFSEKYGYKKVDNSLVWEDIPIGTRKRLWKRINEFIFEPAIKHLNNNLLCEDFYGDMPQGLGMHMPEPGYLWKFLDSLYDKFFPPNFNELYTTGYTGFDIYRTEKKCIDVKEKKQEIEEWFKSTSTERNRILHFINFLNEYYLGEDIKGKLNIDMNKVLAEEKSPYRIIKGIVTLLTDEEQIKEIEKALNPPDRFAPVREHIKNALKHLSDKKEPNYEDSIRESIHAVESLAKIITGKDKSLSGLIQSLKDIPFNLREGFKELYNWSSKTLRHGKSGKELPTGFEEAIYMMVTCSAFVNYVIAKYGEGEIGEEGDEQ